METSTTSPKALDYNARHGYLTKPVETSGMPPAVPYIVSSEAAERFSFYGMRAILAVFMTKYLCDSSGKLATMNEEEAKYWQHLFIFAVYFFPLFGAIIADGFLGKYRTIIYLSIVYCFGHMALALDDTRLGLFMGLSLIVMGAGGIKPCVAATVGDQFGSKNQHLLPRVFSWFYFSINLGSFLSMLTIPEILDKYGAHWAFAIPGILMAIATAVFWAGRHKYAHAPAQGVEFVKETFSLRSLGIIGRLIVLYVFVAAFWSLFDQTSSAWVLQAEKMNREFLGKEWLASQVQAVNPLFILAFIPLFSYVLYPAANRFFELTPLRKIAIGFFTAIPSFVIPAWVEWCIGLGEHPAIYWHIIAYIFMTAAEILISITCLEFSYTQAPKRMKSLVMSIYLCSIALGNLFTALVNKFIQNADGTSKLPGANYYVFFTGLIVVTSIGFLFVTPLLKKKQMSP